jgi:hypothetical protein
LELPRSQWRRICTNRHWTKNTYESSQACVHSRCRPMIACPCQGLRFSHVRVKSRLWEIIGSRHRINLRCHVPGGGVGGCATAKTVAESVAPTRLSGRTASRHSYLEDCQHPAGRREDMHACIGPATSQVHMCLSGSVLQQAWLARGCQRNMGYNMASFASSA